MISIKNISVSYHSNPVINSLNLNLIENSIHGIVGLNGAGKTTLFDAIFGLKEYSFGTISFDGNKLTKKDIAYLPVDSYFYSNITGLEYLELFYNLNFDITSWNNLFKLPLKQVIDEYSTGMKKKLALLGVVKQNKPIIILDEPFNGLDVEMYRIMQLILIRLKESGKTIIVSSHMIEGLTDICDYIHYLCNGNIECSKSKEEFALFKKELFDAIEKDNSQLINQLINIVPND